MSEKKNFSKRTSQGDRRNNRNSLKNVRDIFSSCDTVGRNTELEQSKNTRVFANDADSLETGQYRLSDVGETVSCNAIRDEGCNLNSHFSKNNDECGDVMNCMEEFSTPPASKYSQRVRHLPLKTISSATIANISKKINKLKEEMINFSPGSTSSIPKSDNSASKKAYTKKKPNLIVLPKEHMKVLQQRIKCEIENLKQIEGIDQKLKEQESALDFNDGLDFEDLGSDIQFLSAEEREKVLKKSVTLESDEKLKSVKEENSDTVQIEEPVIMIDLTKESTPVCMTEKTEMDTENNFPSFDLDYGSKINWDDGEKLMKIKHSTSGTDKPTVNLDIDETKLTVETSKKISDIKNRLFRSLSIGLSHKEAGEKISKELKEESKLNIPDTEEKNECLLEDAETLELASLRCTSERTEVIADRERRRKRRCADYPGLAFGFSIFSSDTMMKFNIIRNELHNIMKTQLKRVGIGLNFMLSLFLS